MDKIYEPIIKKIDSWIDYYDTLPKGEYIEHKREFEEHRRKHDLDCILTGGNLYADTIISLWTPLKNLLYYRASYHDNVFDVLGVKKIFKSQEILVNIKNHLEEVLPANEKSVILLSKLFEIGQERCNVMLLPNRSINSKRGMAPYYDYVPYFLYECFEGGEFSNYFSNNEQLRCWIKSEHLQDFFVGGRLVKENIKDLAHTGNLENGIPIDIIKYLEGYIDVLMCRKNRMN